MILHDSMFTIQLSLLPIYRDITQQYVHKPAVTHIDEEIHTCESRCWFQSGPCFHDSAQRPSSPVRLILRLTLPVSATNRTHTTVNKLLPSISTNIVSLWPDGHAYLPSVPRHCWSSGRKGIWPVKSWVLVHWWWRFDWSFARVTAPVVTTISITLSSNKIQNGDILIPANPGPPGKNGR